jgi:signal transduction histidine kinase
MAVYEVKNLVAGRCAEVEPLVMAKPDVELTCEVPDDIGEANTDQGRLRQILMNLLSNAIKFTDRGEVTVRASKIEEQLVISVSDTGSGIPSDALETVFEEFQQVKGSDPQHKGTGLGLPICKGFAELLGGSIWVESEVGKGSTFTIRIPMIYKKS